MFRRVVDEDYVVCMVNMDHPLASKESLTLDEFISYPHISVMTGGGWDRIIDRPLHALGLKRNIKIRVPSYRLAFSVASCTEFLVVVPRHVVRNSLNAKDMKEFQIPFTVDTVKMSLWWHESHHKDCAHKWLRDVMFPQLLNHPNHKGLSAERPQLPHIPVPLKAAETFDLAMSYCKLD